MREQCIAEQLEVERVSGDKALALYLYGVSVGLLEPSLIQNTLFREKGVSRLGLTVE